MSEINLANWEIVDDAANNRIVIRSKSTGEEIELNESGTFSSTGSIDIDSLAFNTVEIAGSTVKLGASLTLDHTDLTNVNSGQHHARYSDEEAQDAVGTTLNSDFTYNDSNNSISLSSNSVTVDTGSGLTGGGTASLGNSVTVSHADTSNQSNVSAGGGAAITDVNLDGNGHVTSLSTTDLDGRFILEAGDTMSGTLTMDNNVVLNNTNNLVLNGTGSKLQFADTDTNHYFLRYEATRDAIRIDDSGTGGKIAYFESGPHTQLYGTLGLPRQTSDPSANAGDMWYRTDLD